MTDVHAGSYKEVILFLVTAGVVVPLFHRLRISPVLGFIGAGALLGPFGLGRFAETHHWVSTFTIANRAEIAHLAESFNAPIAPHFLMELHVSLVCAVPNALYLEHIPQLRAVTSTELRIEDGRAWAPTGPGLGIDWNDSALAGLVVA